MNLTEDNPVRFYFVKFRLTTGFRDTKTPVPLLAYPFFLELLFPPKKPQPPLPIRNPNAYHAPLLLGA